MIENKTVPLEVTETLQQIADYYRYTADQMHQQKLQIVTELYQRNKGYIVKFLFPNGLDDNDRWIHALIRTEVRRLQK
ncbi:hypothetical protein MK805_14510 [Shimazuella sp. AN120528]|nr:hypothetical protein [Shimazuella soli]